MEVNIDDYLIPDELKKNRKLSDSTILEIITKYNNHNYTITELSREYGVTPQAIRYHVDGCYRESRRLYYKSRNSEYKAPNHRKVQKKYYRRKKDLIKDNKCIRKSDVC
jgi:predicted transcriptional regulator